MILFRALGDKDYRYKIINNLRSVDGHKNKSISDITEQDLFTTINPISKEDINIVRRIARFLSAKFNYDCKNTDIPT